MSGLLPRRIASKSKKQEITEDLGYLYANVSTYALFNVGFFVRPRAEPTFQKIIEHGAPSFSCFYLYRQEIKILEC